MGYRLVSIRKRYYKWLPKESRSNIDELDNHEFSEQERDEAGAAHKDVEPRNCVTDKGGVKSWNCVID
jgi:hypothetical protein